MMTKYIDADKLSEDIRLRYCKDCSNHNEVKCRACWIDDMLGEIEDAPTADVAEVKYGRWKGAGLGDYLCSRCQEVYSGGNNFTYCPCCGAKMDGGEK